jgi:hypothetical protein
MVATYKHASGDTVICHGLDHAGEAGYYTGPIGSEDSASASWQVQPSPRIRTPSSIPYDRGNGLYAFSLRVERRYASEDAARAAARLLPGSIPRFGASIEITGETAGKKTVMDAAALSSVSTVRTGCSLDITFSFQTSIPREENIP